jgi:methyl-accepting chemotaxis protein
MACSESKCRKILSESRSASKTNEAFRKASEESGKVPGLVSEIAAASNEQAQGIDQADSAVSEMGRTVQQNAANAEEPAGAAQKMSHLIEKKGGIVINLCGSC